MRQCHAHIIAVRRYAAVVLLSLAFLGAAAGFAPAAADYPTRKILCIRGGGNALIDIVAQDNRAKLLEKISVKDLGPVTEVAFNRRAQTAGIPANAPVRWLKAADVVLAPRAKGVAVAKQSGKAASGAQLGGKPTDLCAAK